MKAFAQLLESYFQETAQVNGNGSRHFEIAGNPVTLEFSGNRWTDQITSAISHLEVPAPPAPTDRRIAPRLTAFVWDGSVEPRNHLLRAYLFALTNWWFDYTGPRGELLDIHSERMPATYHPDMETLSVVDLERAKAFYWKRNASPLLYYEKCSPFRSLLHSWMRSVDRYFVHGAAVGHENGGVLLVGKGGSGKSTSALSCLRSGMRYAGDDYCIVRESSSGGYDVHSLYCTAKLVAVSDLEAFPGLMGKVVNPRRDPGEKVAISLADYKAGQLIDRFPLRAILVPVITHRTETAILPCSPQEALMAIAPSTLAQLPASGKRDLEFLGNLVRRIPCYRLLLGTDLRQVPGSISEILQGLCAEGRIGATASATPTLQE